MTAADTGRPVFLRDLRLQVSIGNHDFERSARPAVAVNADLGPAPPARAIGDDIANVVDYDFLHAGIVRLAPSRHFNLQKTLCEAVLDRCLSPSEVIEARVSTERSDVYPDCRVGCEAVRRCA